VEGPVRVHRLGVHGDIQADRINHGGEDQAIYAYSQADADYWAGELQRDLPPGFFGENLRVAGIETTGAVIGERWKIGLDLEVEVTSPRTPCAAFQRRVGVPRFV
jgi:MOSC domain-containing protein YiiM